MGKIRVRLAIVFISLIAVSVLICGLLSAKLLRDSLLDSMGISLEEQLQVISQHIGGQSKSFQALDVTSKQEVLAGLVQSTHTKIGWLETNQVASDDLSKRAKRALAKTEKHHLYTDRETGNHMMLATVPWPNDNRPQGYIFLAKSVERVDASTQRFWNALVLGLIIVFVVASIISWRLAQGITQPIENITRIAGEIKTFDFRSRAAEHNKDEVGQLGHAINTMATSLEQQLFQIRENETRFKTVLDNMVTGIILLDEAQNITLLNNRAAQMIDYTPTQLIGQLYSTIKHPVELPALIQSCIESGRSIREELTIYYPIERIVEINIVPLYFEGERYRGLIAMIHDITTIRKLEMMRREFVANVSHEIKTPLTALKGFAETLLSGALDDRETAQTFLQIIYNEANRLNRLITDILQLSKMESGQYTLSYSPVELKPLFEKLLKMMKTQADGKSIAMHIKVDDAMYIEADEDLLMQILINLTSNAINYTPNGGKVAISAAYMDTQDDSEKIRIVVSDTGIGIPKQDQERIFERFYRVDKARSRDSGGTGLGLSIVKHLVELHHGTISVESRHGFGSEFSIELPLIQQK
jgi:two-component system phosphate regulon sensor histidine kinase PhoR